MDKGIHPARPAGRCPGAAEPLRPRRLATVFRHFLRASHLLAEREAPLRVRFAGFLRSARVFLHPRANAELAALETFNEYVAPCVGSDVFHHLNRRYYLAKNLSLRQRVAFLLTHYRFEEAMFAQPYRQKVYRDGGLVLWNRQVNGTEFSITLALALRYAAEGDLSVTMMVDGERLHCISFSWASSEFARGNQAVVPFITANQGRLRQFERAQEKFDAAFPQQAASYACYAAMQGIAQAIGAPEMLAVSSRLQVCYAAKDAKHFNNSYDLFWDAVGGVGLPRCGYALPVPRPQKPLEKVAAKHRKRTAAKRTFWQEITESASAAISALLRTR